MCFALWYVWFREHTNSMTSRSNNNYAISNVVIYLSSRLKVSSWQNHCQPTHASIQNRFWQEYTKLHAWSPTSRLHTIRKNLYFIESNRQSWKLYLLIIVFIIGDWANLVVNSTKQCDSCKMQETITFTHICRKVVRNAFHVSYIYESKPNQTCRNTIFR